MLSLPYGSASWLRHHQPHESAVELRRRSHVDNVTHCLLMTAVTEVWCDKAPFVQESTAGRWPVRKWYSSVHVWRARSKPGC